MPAHPPDPANERVHDVLAEFLERRAAGEAIDLTALESAHPSIAGELRRLGPLFESLADRSRVSVDVESTLGARPPEFDSGVQLEPRPTPPSDDATKRIVESLREVAPRSQRYEVLDEVGRGGMGVVMSVWDQDLCRTAAL